MKESTRAEIARNAAAARWSDTKQFERAISLDWESVELETLRERIEALHRVYQQACSIYKKREGAQVANAVHCLRCNKTIAPGKWMSSQTVKDALTGGWTNIYFCSSVCFDREQIDKRGGVVR